MVITSKEYEKIKSKNEYVEKILKIPKKETQQDIIKLQTYLINAKEDYSDLIGIIEKLKKIKTWRQWEIYESYFQFVKPCHLYGITGKQGSNTLTNVIFSMLLDKPVLAVDVPYVNWTYYLENDVHKAINSVHDLNTLTRRLEIEKMLLIITITLGYTDSYAYGAVMGTPKVVADLMDKYWGLI